VRAEVFIRVESFTADFAFVVPPVKMRVLVDGKVALGYVRLAAEAANVAATPVMVLLVLDQIRRRRESHRALVASVRLDHLSVHRVFTDAMLDDQLGMSQNQITHLTGKTATLPHLDLFIFTFFRMSLEHFLSRVGLITSTTFKSFYLNWFRFFIDLGGVMGLDVFSQDCFVVDACATMITYK
jgi:hypothetical protein